MSDWIAGAITRMHKHGVPGIYLHCMLQNHSTSNIGVLTWIWICVFVDLCSYIKTMTGNIAFKCIGMDLQANRQNTHKHTLFLNVSLFRVDEHTCTHTHLRCMSIHALKMYEYSCIKRVNNMHVAIASFPKTPFFPTELKGNAQGFHWIRA